MLIPVEIEKQIMGIVTSSIKKEILIVDINDCNFKLAIVNDDRTEEQIQQFAKEFKVQIMILFLQTRGTVPEIRVSYKSVSRQEFNQLVSEMVSKFRDTQ